MKFNSTPQNLKFIIPGAGALCLALRFALYAVGIDGRGLLTENHPLSIAVWGLSIAAGAGLLLFGRSIKGSAVYADAYPVSFAGFLGCFAAAAGLVVTGVRSFGDFTAPLDIFIWVLGFAAAAALACVGICRLIGAKPYFLLHAVVCVYFTLRMISRYRGWNADPCLQNYFFHLMAQLALVLTAYHHAAFDAAMGSHRGLWISSLAGVYLCIAALYGCDEPLLMAGCAIWCLTNLTNLTVRKRRVRPVLKLDPDEARGT